MTTDIVERLYPEVDHEALGDHYLRHVDAMTREGLHAKSAIAAQLAHRDAEIERLRADGPMMLRGHDDTGAEWMGTMRQVMDDYRMAAEAEANEVERLRAEVEALRVALQPAQASTQPALAIGLYLAQRTVLDLQTAMRIAPDIVRMCAAPANTLKEHTNGR